MPKFRGQPGEVADHFGLGERGQQGAVLRIVLRQSRRGVALEWSRLTVARVDCAVVFKQTTHATTAMWVDHNASWADKDSMSASVVWSVVVTRIWFVASSYQRLKSKPPMMPLLSR